MLITYLLGYLLLFNNLLFLGVPALPNGTGEAQASAVFNLVEEWGIAGHVRSMSFDTTSSNTGRQGGACVLLERKLGTILLSLAVWQADITCTS